MIKIFLPILFIFLKIILVYSYDQPKIYNVLYNATTFPKVTITGENFINVKIYINETLTPCSISNFIICNSLDLKYDTYIFKVVNNNSSQFSQAVISFNNDFNIKNENENEKTILNLKITLVTFGVMLGLVLMVFFAYICSLK
jgi:hypothetical protein